MPTRRRRIKSALQDSGDRALPSSRFRALYNIAEVRAAARRILPRPIFDFADGAAEDELTLRRNTEYWPGHSFLFPPHRG